MTPLPAPVVALWATCLAHHGATPVVGSDGATWMRSLDGTDTLLAWPVESVADALVRAAEKAPVESWGAA